MDTSQTFPFNLLVPNEARGKQANRAIFLRVTDDGHAKEQYQILRPHQWHFTREIVISN